MPNESKTKIRPQQSCLRCRERKVKCDRSIPCHACILRGLEAECTYLTTPEDRAHISQSEIIAQLRREVAQLRGRLNQPPRELSHNKRASSDHGSGHIKSQRQQGPNTGYVFGAGTGSSSARCTPDAGEGSWRGSSPSSTMTNSVIVTSPDSTESENGGRSASVSSVSAYPVATGNVPQIAELDGSTVIDPYSYGNLDDATMSNCYTGGMAFAPGDMAGTVPVPMQGFPANGVGIHPPLYTNDTYLLGSKAPPCLTQYPTVPTSTMTHYGKDFPTSNRNGHLACHPLGVDIYGNPTNPMPAQVPQMHPYQTQAHYSTISSFNPTITNTNINAYADPNFPLPTPTNVTGEPSSHTSPTFQDRPSPTTIMDSMPSSWKGEGKQALLEILLETIGSCDEDHLPQVIQVLRTSPSPEDAVSGVCRVLGIGIGNGIGNGG